MMATCIKVILIQIHEAHSTDWPVYLENQPKPQSSYSDRLSRVRDFNKTDLEPLGQYINMIFKVYVDQWNDQFEQRYRSWTDVCYPIDQNMKVVNKSTCGKNADALIDVDCLDLVKTLIYKS